MDNVKYAIVPILLPEIGYILHNGMLAMENFDI